MTDWQICEAILAGGILIFIGAFWYVIRQMDSRLVAVQAQEAVRTNKPCKCTLHPALFAATATASGMCIMCEGDR